MSVVLTGTMALPPDRRAAVLSELDHHIALSRAERGCLQFIIEVRESEIYVAEKFATDADFRAHQDRIVGTEWERVTRGLKRHYQIERGGQKRA